jgi:hypothetical protein
MLLSPSPPFHPFVFATGGVSAVYFPRYESFHFFRVGNTDDRDTRQSRRARRLVVGAGVARTRAVHLACFINALRYDGKRREGVYDRGCVACHISDLRKREESRLVVRVNGVRVGNTF